MLNYNFSRWRRALKDIYDFILKNSGLLIGVIGVVGTFYFSLFYVPGYVKDLVASKGNVVHEALMDDIQEILFYEKGLSIEDIRSFIHGKELKQGITYAFTPNELLVQVQERFMGNKFIPLEKREALLKRIKSIRENYKPSTNRKGRPFNWASVAALLASSLGILLSVFGATSITRKIKADNETEFDFAVDEVAVKNFSSTSNVSYRQYEKMVEEVLVELRALKSSNPVIGDRRFDFLASKGDQEYIVEVKYFRNMLGVGTARDFLYSVLQSEENGILVVSSGVTERTKKLFSEHNKMSKNKKVFLVSGDSVSEIKEQLQSIFEDSSTLVDRI